VNPNKKTKITFVIGTRPELIKLAPVLKLFRASSCMDVRVVFTAQHRGLLDQLAGFFGVVPDIDLNLMREGQTLSELSARALVEVQRVLAELEPDVVMAQGDTTTVLMAALASYYLQIPFVHLEAGLRSADLYSPFPEEGNRRMASVLTRLHLAPTPLAKQNLVREGISPESIVVTGNTVIDAAMATAARSPRSRPPNGRRRILVTVHRRENHGDALGQIIDAVRTLSRLHEDVDFIWPVHPNPAVKSRVQKSFSGSPRVRVVKPMNYGDLIRTLAGSTLILTDSGGLQEEGPALNVPVLVLRTETERPEGIMSNSAWLVGTKTNAIVAATSLLLREEHLRREMQEQPCPYGDGQAASRVHQAIVDLASPEGSAPAVIDFDPVRPLGSARTTSFSGEGSAKETPWQQGIWH
jgi:UDP-N-acetylglucosamine 2-epimerase (non-hydrolysing)